MGLRVSEAFERINVYFFKPLVLVPLQSDVALILYLTTSTTVMGAMLAQKVKDKAKAIYYVSKKFLEY